MEVWIILIHELTNVLIRSNYIEFQNIFLMSKSNPYICDITGNNKTQRLEDLITRKYLEDKTHLDDPPYFTDEVIQAFRHYLHPYLAQLDNITNFDFLEVVNQYPPKLKDDIIEYAKGKGYYLTQIDALLNRHGPTYSFLEVKRFILNRIMDHLMVGANDDLVDPWDMIFQFRSSEVPQQLFHLNSLTEREEEGIDPITVDVDVTIDNRKFTHKMSKELVKGIITVYKELGLLHPFSMYGGMK